MAVMGAVAVTELADGYKIMVRGPANTETGRVYSVHLV